MNQTELLHPCYVWLFRIPCGWNDLTRLISPLIQLVGHICIAGLQLLDLRPLALDVRAELLVSLLQRAAQLLCGLKILTQLLHVILSPCHSLPLVLITAKGIYSYLKPVGCWGKILKECENAELITWRSSVRVLIAFGWSGIGPSSLSFFSKPETSPSTLLIWFSKLRDAFALENIY